MKTITFYPKNRKLYDRDTKKYTNLSEIISYIKQDIDITIINKETNEIVTNKHLTEALNLLDIPISNLRGLIRQNKIKE